jgi:hypothetical protein
MNVVMKKSKPSKQPVSGSPRAAHTPPAQPDALQSRIEAKAYELWDARGRRPGSALEDWLDAEQIVMGEARESRNQ